MQYRRAARRRGGQPALERCERDRTANGGRPVFLLPAVCLMPNDPYRMNAADLVATALLDMRFPPQAVRGLLNENAEELSDRRLPDLLYDVALEGSVR
jgi:hypothetical protein